MNKRQTQKKSGIFPCLNFPVFRICEYRSFTNLEMSTIKLRDRESPHSVHPQYILSIWNQLVPKQENKNPDFPFGLQQIATIGAVCHCLPRSALAGVWNQDCQPNIKPRNQIWNVDFWIVTIIYTFNYDFFQTCITCTSVLFGTLLYRPPWI